MLTQDSCTVCAKCTIGLEIILDALDATPGDEAQVDAHFGLFGDIVLVSVQGRCMVCAKHAIGSEIILNAPDGTPRWRGSSGSSFWSVWRQC
jgi:hypothetical protein